MQSSQQIPLLRCEKIRPTTGWIGAVGDTLYSTAAYLHTDAYFAGFSVGEVNAGLFKRFLYL
jgi:hypothetical protein